MCVCDGKEKIGSREEYFLTYVRRGKKMTEKIESAVQRSLVRFKEDFERGQLYLDQKPRRQNDWRAARKGRFGQGVELDG